MAEEKVILNDVTVETDVNKYADHKSLNGEGGQDHHSAESYYMEVWWYWFPDRLCSDSGGRMMYP